MKSLIAAILTLALPAQALAHPGHVAEAGHGHSHMVALAILALLALAALGWLVARALARASRRSAQRRAGK